MDNWGNKRIISEALLKPPATGTLVKMNQFSIKHTKRTTLHWSSQQTIISAVLCVCVSLFAHDWNIGLLARTKSKRNCVCLCYILIKKCLEFRSFTTDNACWWCALPTVSRLMRTPSPSELSPVSVVSLEVCGLSGTEQSTDHPPKKNIAAQLTISKPAGLLLIECLCVTCV